MTVFTEFELGVLETIQSIRCGFLDFIIPKISFLGNSGLIWIAAALLLLCFKKTRKWGITLAIALIMCLLLNNLTLKNLVARPRPFQVDTTIQLIISPPNEYSFPSGHALSCFAAATVLLYYDKKRLGPAALILAALIGFTRLYLRVHFPSDVLGGAIIGVFFGFLAIAAAQAAFKAADRFRDKKAKEK
ncbi:MAG: phosphatase PAP2 family protein [Clostridia bacterium]|nr:phosphatase PAP2 family protein [Clostridia bacterium]